MLTRVTVNVRHSRFFILICSFFNSLEHYVSERLLYLSEFLPSWYSFLDFFHSFLQNFPGLVLDFYTSFSCYFSNRFFRISLQIPEKLSPNFLLKVSGVSPEILQEFLEVFLPGFMPVSTLFFFPIFFHENFRLYIGSNGKLSEEYREVCWAKSLDTFRDQSRKQTRIERKGSGTILGWI